MKNQSKDAEYFSVPQYRNYYIRYFNMLHEMIVNRFEWLGLPEEIPPRVLEDYLFWWGQAVFFKDDVLEKYATMKTNLGGTVDIYGVPNMRFAYAQQYFKTLGKNNSVIIWDSSVGYPSVDYVQMYAESLSNMRMTRNLNIYAQRTPVVIAGSENQRLSTKNLFKQYNDFVPFISVKDGISNVESMKVLNLNPPNVFGDLTTAMRQEIADFCVQFGISNIDGTKKERLITSEVEQDADLTLINRQSFLGVRKRACEQINRLFGLSVDVRYIGNGLGVERKENLANGGVENGDIYNQN